MSQKILITLFWVAGLLGLADALYLSITVILGVAPTCGVLHGCETVMRSSYSHYILGIHDAYLAVAYFVGTAIIGGYVATSRLWQKIALIYTTFGLVVACWSVFVMKFLIGAYCSYCLGIDAMLLSLFILSLSVLRSGDRGTTPPL